MPLSGFSMVETRCSTYSSTGFAYGVTRPTCPPSGRSQSSSRCCSICFSTASSSLRPPRARNLMPLSGIGLCEALMTTPRSAPRAWVMYATAGVGSTRSRSTSTPADASPATTACSRNCPEMRVSRPTTATGRCPAKVPWSTSTRAAAAPRSTASSAVTTPLARPRTPSVPKIRWVTKSPPSECPAVGSALAELRSLAGLLQTGLLAFDDACISGEQARLLQRRAVRVDVDGVQRPSDTEAERAGLARDATTVDAGDDVEPAVELERCERLLDDLLVELVREVGVEGAAVDGPDARAGHDPYSGDGFLAASGGGSRRDGGRASRVGRRRALGG